jgi:hypothetical protein
LSGGRFAGLLLCATLALTAQTRRALVVGIGEYKGLTQAPQADANARAFARTLSASQFQVALLLNVEADAFAREINKFLQDLKPGDTSVFYFSGYAVQEMGENYLLPVGFAPASTDGIEFQSYSVKRLVRYLETKKLAAGLVILDPATPNSVVDKKFPEPGLASMDIRAANLVLAIANLPGRSVPAARGREISRYTEAWVKTAAEPGVNIDAALRRIKQQVSQATNGEQVPSEISTLVNDFAFVARSPAAAEWERLSASKDPLTLEAFRQRFPGDPLAFEAARRIEAIEWERIKAAPDAKSVRQFLARFPQHQEALKWLSSQENNEKTNSGAAVLSTLERYGKAYESRDLDALQAIRPGLSGAERKRLEQAFREFKSIHYTLAPAGEPVIEATAATVKCRLKVEMRTNDGGSPRPVDQPVTVKLSRKGDAWIIDSIQ